MLEARNITFGYPGAAKALFDGFSLAVEPGERVALSAPSGTGKTTLCRILAGYERPQAGDVLADGDPLPQRGACPVQLIGQHPELAVDPRLRLERTLAEAQMPDGARKTPDSAGKAPGIVRKAPGGLLDALGIRPEWLRRYPHELSGGELQRFCIARALIARPRYLIADESTTMLDAVTQAEIWRFLLNWQRETNAGLVVVTHSPALQSRLVSRVISLR